MKLEGVQQYVADRIMDVPALAAFGAPILYSPFLDDVALKTDITNRLNSVGAVIEIAGVEAERTGDPATIRGVVADASFEVFAAESQKLAHAPTGDLFRKAVIEAITAFVPHETRAEFHHSETAKSDNGYVLHVLTFTMRVSVP